MVYLGDLLCVRMCILSSCIIVAEKKKKQKTVLLRSWQQDAFGNFASRSMCI